MAATTADAAGEPRAKIMVVDDEAGIVTLLTAMLERSGYQTVAAYTAAEALQHIHEERPALVMLDIFLPDCNGLDLMDDLKRLDPGLDVIVMTGIGDDEMGKRALQRGAVEFIRKPFDFDYLNRVVGAQLKIHDWEN